MEKLQKSDQLLSNKYVYSEKLWCKAANRGVIWKKSVLTNYTIIAGNHLCRSLFFNGVVQSLQDILDRIGKYSKIGWDKESLMSTFARFLTAIAGVYFLEGRLSSWLYLKLNFRFF